jgi:hypothetical protein
MKYRLEILACNLLGGVCLPLTGATFVLYKKPEKKKTTE